METHNDDYEIQDSLNSLARAPIRQYWTLGCTTEPLSLSPQSLHHSENSTRILPNSLVETQSKAHFSSPISNGTTGCENPSLDASIISKSPCENRGENHLPDGTVGDERFAANSKSLPASPNTAHSSPLGAVDCEGPVVTCNSLPDSPNKTYRSMLYPNGTVIYESPADSPKRVSHSASSTPRSRIFPGSGNVKQPRRSHMHKDWKLAHTDSGQSSLECWDYSVEIDMLKGPEDLQLAAELGKTLLEHNRSLETTVKQQQALLDDRLQEIQYLNRQTAALRVVNDTRLTVYEKLEVSMQEFEKDNARLAMQAAHDRRTIKSLQSTIESLQTAMEGLEARNLELQRSVDEARTAGLTAARGRLKRRVEDGLFRRSMSCENSNQDERSSGDEEGDDVTEQLAAQLKELRAKLDAETRKRDEVETELYALAKEHDAVLQQVAELQERQAVPATLRQELDALDEDREDDAKHRACRKCLCNGGDVSTSPTVFDESIEDDYSMTSDRGGCLVRLANGVLAYGSQESLASMGQVMSHGNSTMTSPLTDGSEVPHNSLLSELDAQYQLLIDKYQELLKAGDERDRAEMMKAQHGADNGVYITSEAEDMSGPISMVLPGSGTNEDVLRKCQRCSKCSCGITGTTHRPKSNLEEFSEVETSSSGFSEGESRLSNKTTQTELTHLNRMDELTPIVEVHEMDTILDLTSPINPCENRFQAAPNFKELFNEIFTVLKKNENVSDGEHLVSSPERATAEEPCESSKICESTGNDDEVSTTMSGSTAVGDPEADESVLQTLSGNDGNSSFTTASTEGLNPKDNSDETSHLTGKLARPNSLDLSNTSSSSRSSSKQRRRKRQQPKSKAELALLKQNELNSANAVRPVASTSVSPKKKANSRPEKELKSQLNEREPPPKIIGSKVDLMDLCERHRQLQNKRKNKRNRSRNSSKSRTQVKITTLDELGNIPSQSSFGSEALRQRPSSGVYTSHLQRLQHKFGEVNPESRPNKMNFSIAPSPKKSAAPQPKICLPSAELAKFRKLEASYAQVLKAQIERAANRRK